MIGVKLEGDRRLFLTQILANKSTSDKCFGIGKGILLLVIDFFDVDGRETLLFASALYQFKCQSELAGRVDLVKEGGLCIFLFAANVLAAVNGIFQGGRFEREVKIQGARTNIDFCNLLFVCVGVNRPAHALFGALIAHECVADCAIILFGSGARLHQFCLAALAIASNDVATRLFVKAYDALIAKEIAFVFVVVLFCIGFSFGFILCFDLIFGIDFFCFDFLFFGLGKRRSAFALLRGMLNSNLFFHTELGLELHELGDRLHHFLGSRAELLCFATLGNGGGIGFFDNFSGGFNDVLFNDGGLSVVSRCAFGNNSALNGFNYGLNRFLGNNSGFFNNLRFLNLFCYRFFLFILFGHNGILSCNQVGDSFLCRLVVFVIVVLFFDGLFLTVELFGSGNSDCLLLCSLCSQRFCLLLGSFSFCLCGNEEISLGIKNSQKDNQHKCSNCASDCKHQKGQLCRHRNRAKGQRGYGIVRASVLIIFVLCDVHLTAARTTQFADEHTNACDFSAQNKRQNCDGNVVSVFYAQCQ